MDPLLLGSVLLDDNGAMVVDLANADLHDAEGRVWLQQGRLRQSRRGEGKSADECGHCEKFVSLH